MNGVQTMRESIDISLQKKKKKKKSQKKKKKKKKKKKSRIEENSLATVQR
jgi:GTP1/Obg family GTP-binding protein